MPELSTTEINNRIKEAKKYADRIVDEEVNANDDVRKSIKKYLIEIIDLSLKSNISGERFRFSSNPKLEDKVNEILGKLREKLYAITENRSLKAKKVAEEKEGNTLDNVLIISFLSSKIGEKTLRERINIYSNQLKTEIEAFIAAGKAFEKSRNEIINEWQKFQKSPYSSPLLKEAISNGGFASTRIQSKGIHYGKGRYISAFENLRRLEITTIQQAYNYAVMKLWQNNNRIIGWASFRGSNYPCPICESQVGIPHSIKEDFLGYHPYCMCIPIPLYKGKKL